MDTLEHKEARDIGAEWLCLMAQYGRSKERRKDCKLLVLALTINTDGFIRYSSILE